MLGRLQTAPARQRLDLLAEPTARAVGAWPDDDVLVAAIDPDLADTAAFCAAYGVQLQESANCVVVATRRGEEAGLVAAVVLATTRADVNGLLRRQVGARKASFAPMATAVERSGMEYGGITPIGLPPDWPVLVDAAVAATPHVVVGSGLRRSKLVVPGAALAALPGAQVLDGLGLPVSV